jgi:hypothetical protein
VEREKNISFPSFFLIFAGASIGIIGIIFAVFAQFFYNLGMAEDLIWKFSVALIGAGLPVMIFGFSLMFEAKYKFLSILGVAVSYTGVALFSYYFRRPSVWMYPLTGYIYLIYASGIIIELATLFSTLITQKIKELAGFKFGKREEAIAQIEDTAIEMDLDHILKNSKYAWASKPKKEPFKYTVKSTPESVHGEIDRVVKKADRIDQEIKRMRSKVKTEEKKDAEVDKIVRTLSEKSKEKKEHPLKQWLSKSRK